MTISQTLAEYVTGTNYADLPAEAISAAKRMMLDTLGVAWAGTDAPSSTAVRDFLVRQGGNPESHVWAYGDKLPATSSAFLNSMFAAALDYDTLHERAVVHADIIALPVAMAISEREHTDGCEFLTALVLGNDLICRLGKSTTRHSGWFYTSIHGVFGAAAVAAKLLHLDAIMTRHALGVALSHVGGTQQPAVERSLTKRLQSAFAAQAGVFSALLAANGVTAPSEAFEGKFGFYRMYEEGDPSSIVEELGHRFENTSMSFKKYPSCACNHAAIEATLHLAQANELSANEINEIKVVISPYMNRLVGGAFDPGDNPQVAAQFSVQYSVACAILHRRLGIQEIREQAVLDPSIRELVKLVKVIVDEANTGKLAPAEVIIETKTKGALTYKIDYIPGSPEHPMSEVELHKKFRECTELGVAPKTYEQSFMLIERINRLEDLSDMAEFFKGIL